MLGEKMAQKTRFCSLIACAAALIAAQAYAGSPMYRSSVYCKKDGHGPNHPLKIFAYRVEANGDLKFGLELWNEFGNSRTNFGVAHRRGDRWIYRSGMDSADPDAHCRLEITVKPDGGAAVKADPVAQCKAWGGAGTEIDVVEFPRSIREGGVTTQLKDSDTFSNTAGKCSGQ